VAARRLQEAEGRVAELEAEYESAKAKDGGEAAAKAQAEAEARFDGVTDVRVVEIANTFQPGNVLASSFEITYTKPRFDRFTQQCPPVERTVRGFRGVPQPAFLYLLEKVPERIPASIMALAPGDPHSAFGAYFIGLRRGYI